uniref:Lipocalin/cytosolic fatty-acid binding domain-containing protein n=1 Tax=Daphnia galeata TaxID=27404 RepID=A0A8J2WN52_9CRUS|nr:unnamed protein product [Daphnia galeata]
MKNASIIFFVVFQVIVKSHLSLNQSAKWPLQFSFTGYGRQNQDFLMKNSPTNITVNVAQTDTLMGCVVNFTIYKGDNDFTGKLDRERMEMKGIENDVVERSLFFTRNGAFIAKNLTSTSRLTGNYSKTFKSGRKNKAKCLSV